MYNYPNGSPTYVRSFNGDSIQLQPIVGVVFSGDKPVWKIILSNGLSIRATEDHKFMSDSGWVQLRDLSVGKSNLMCDTLLPAKSNTDRTKIVDKVVVGLRHHPFVHVIFCSTGRVDHRLELHRVIYEANLNGLSVEEYVYILRADPNRSAELRYINPTKYVIHHKDGDHFNNELSNLECVTKSEHRILHSNQTKFNFGQGAPKYSIVASIEFSGIVPTYDIQCSEHHNFVANGMVAHNSGKTVMLIKMWSLIGRTALVVVPKTDLVNQWRERIMEFTDIPAHRIGIAQQGLCEYEGKAVVIGMIHSLCKDRYPEEFKNHFGLVIFDELHKLGAFYFSRVGGMFPAKYRIGATATLKRSDGLERAFMVHLGDEIIKLQKSEQPIPEIAVYKYSKTSGSIPHYLQDSIQRRGVLISKLAGNLERTKIISDFTKQLVESGRQTLVVSERIPHLETMKRLLVRAGLKSESIGFYLGATKKAERIRVANECQCILATTSMLSLGTDIPTLRGLVFATPVSGVTQPIGRIRRINPDLKDPFVLDFVDSFYEECNRWYGSRRYFYDSIKSNVHEITG